MVAAGSSLSAPGSAGVQRVGVGILGCGTVGSALVGLLAERRSHIAARSGVVLEPVAVAVRSPERPRPGVPAELIGGDTGAVVAHPGVDVVVELMGGLTPARELLLAALAAGKPVVTANKELLATHGTELFAAAHAAGVDLLFEAAVAGAIPLVRALRESLAGEPVRRVAGIVNGTTNYILSRMTDAGATYADALAEAQALGYAESDPRADVGGLDAAAKAAIIARIVFGVELTTADVHCEGITTLTPNDIAFARRLGYVIKLLAIAERVDDGAVAVRVHPAMVPDDHPLAAVRESFNAVFVEGAAAGELMLYGRGAGGRPTASAVLGDLIAAATGLQRGPSPTPPPVAAPVGICPIGELRTAYYLALEVIDRPGVLAAVAGVFGRHGISIRSMEQEGLGAEARIIFITHVACEGDMRATLDELRHLDAVRQVGSVLRVIAGE